MVDGIVLFNTPTRTAGNLSLNPPPGWDWSSANGRCNALYDSGHVTVRNVKQVAGHWGTSDGFDVGSNSTITDSFIEANDDAIKLIATNQQFSRVTLWKHPIGWAIECGGWGAAPDHHNVRVSDVDIHMIRQPFDKYCCGGGIPECEDRPPQPCGAMSQAPDAEAVTGPNGVRVDTR